MFIYTKLVTDIPVLCPGGGFYGSASTGHIRYLYTLQREMTRQGHDFAIFVLTYTLSPGGVYPLQLKQAAIALNHLLDEENRDPSTVRNSSHDNEPGEEYYVPSSS